MARITKTAAARARELGYRSGLEVRNAKRLDAGGFDYDYEPFKLSYVQPAKPRTYTPDFVLPNGIIIDTKGRWVTEDRQKFKMIVEQHPDLDIRMVFSNPNQRIGKNSPTTYAIYATRLGIPFAKEFIPQAWIDEPINQASLDAIARMT
ncbi:hypothetical protein [Shimia sp.]|uniref:hypothetical protein n=1 Tax=Shimia sp. TaxID=1954381 RepID=UPI003BAB78AB